MITDFRPEKFFELNKSLAGKYLKEYKNVWDIIPNIGDILFMIINEEAEKFTQIDNDIWVGKDTYIEKTALIKGPAIIGNSCEIRHCAYIRGNIIIGNNCVIGNSAELKNSILFDNVQTPHYNYVGDSILGYKAHMGAASILSNLKSDKSSITVGFESQKIYTGLKKFGAVIGDETEIGGGSVLNPGTIIGKRCIIYPLTAVRGYIEEDYIVKDKHIKVKKHKV